MTVTIAIHKNHSNRYTNDGNFSNADHYNDNADNGDCSYLSKDLAKFVEESGDAGVIYFSLGSIGRSSDMPKKYKVMELKLSASS